MKTEKKSQEQVEAERKEIIILKDGIANWLKRVPQSVINGSYQTAVNYKELAKKAGSMLNKKRDNVGQIRQVISEIAAYR